MGIQLTDKQLQKWAITRKCGSHYYAMTRGVCGVGIPILAILLLLKFYFGSELQTDSIAKIKGELIVLIPGTLYFGYYLGKRLWDGKEDAFTQSDFYTE